MKKVSALLLIIVLLYQAGGFALQYLTSDSLENTSYLASNQEKVVVKLPISLPYSQVLEEPRKVSGQVQKGDAFYDMVEQEMVGDTLYTTMVTNHSAREHFLELAEMVDKHLSDDQSNQEHSKSNLISLLIKEYCESRNMVVLYLLDWSKQSSNFIEPKQTLSAFDSEFFSPPRQG